MFLVCSPGAIAADQAATVTLLEGPAVLVRGVTRFTLVEGTRLLAGDIVEVGDKGLAQIEFPDGTALALGAGTRMLAVAMPRGKTAGGNYNVMQGAFKIAGVTRDARPRIVTPVFTLQPAEGTAVALVSGDEGSVFVESGETRLDGQPAKGAAPAPTRLKGGEFFTLKAGQKGVLEPRPSAAFIGGLPKAFFDALPSRKALYAERQVQPRRLDLVTYAEVEAWLKAPPDIRRPLVKRFQQRAAEPAFRSALIANLRFHPEWDPVLYPEKYEKPEPGAADGTPAAR